MMGRILLIVLVLAVASPSWGLVELYASPDGSGDGLTDATPASIHDAKTAVQSHAASGNVIVYLRGGVYDLSSAALQFGAEDSGQNGFKVLWRNYPGETPILSGGVKITGWTLHDAVKNIWKSPVPAGYKARQFWVNGQKSERARWYHPAGGDVNMSRVQSNPIVDKYTESTFPLLSFPTDIELHQSPSYAAWRHMFWGVTSVTQEEGVSVSFRYPQIIADLWNSGEDGNFAFGRKTCSWLENAYEFLDSTTKGRHFLPSTQDYIYYVPRDGEDMAIAEAYLPHLESVIYSSGGMKNIEFFGITVSHTGWLKPTSQKTFLDTQGNIFLNAANGYKTWNDDSAGYVSTPRAGVELYGAENVHFHQSTFEHLGGDAVKFGLGSKNCTVKGSNIRDIAASGARIGSFWVRDADDGTSSYTNYYTADKTDGVGLRSNLFEDIANQYEGGLGVGIGFGQNIDVLHNEFRNLPYTGVSLGWGWTWMTDEWWDDPEWGVYRRDYSRDNSVGYNKFDGVTMKLRDGGAVYSLGYQQGSRVHDNYIEDVGTDAPWAWSGYNPIYADEGSRYLEITRNVIARNENNGPEYAVHINQGSSHGEMTATYNFWNHGEKTVAVTAYNIDGEQGWMGDKTTGNQRIDVNPSLWPPLAKEITQNVGLELAMTTDVIDGRAIVYGWKEREDDVIEIDYGSYSLDSYEEPEPLMWRAELSGVNDDLAQLSVSLLVPPAAFYRGDGSPLLLKFGDGGEVTIRMGDGS